jgi:iron complex transport system ATP-binding protein
MNELAAEQLHFAYRADEVVSGVDLTFPRGAMTALVGPNGAGKSTLLRLLGNLLRPTRGRVLLDGRELSAWPQAELARRMALTPQTVHLYFPFTVGQYVLLARHPHRGWSPFESAADVAAARFALEQTESTHLTERSVLELSGGERQRITLAAALAQAPDWLLLDEPTASLDLRYQVEIFDVLRRLNRERGLSVIVVTHDLNLAARYCPRLILLAGGRVVADGAPPEILDPALIRAHYHVNVEVGRRADGVTPFLLPTGAEPS